jgi:protocatechuate 3,4-dioxygenase beta subunit
VKDLDPGSYIVFAARNGFARQQYGEPAPRRPGVVLNVTAGQAVKDIVFRMIPAGAVSGRVSDAAGEPLPGITVELLRSIYSEEGTRSLQGISSLQTDDRGEYRFSLVTPGRYFLKAYPAQPGSGDPRRMPNEVVDPTLAMTYYPGTLDSSTASSVEILPGAELGAIDFRLGSQQLFRIRGRVIDARTGQPPPNAMLMAIPRNPSSDWGFSSSQVQYNAAGGTFELKNLIPGSYWVRAGTVEPGVIFGPFTGNAAQVAVDVLNGDVENIVLSLGAGFSIRGRILVEGSSLAALRNGSDTWIALSPIGPGSGMAAPQQIKPDGSFVLQNVQPGNYRVDLDPMPVTAYIKYARLGDADLLTGISITTAVSESIEIVLSVLAGQIGGTIVDKDRKPMQGMEAILIPDRQRERRDLYRRSTSDQNGWFLLRTIAPGDYKLFAWQDLEPFAYHDSDFLRRYEELGRSVKVSESSNNTVEVQIIPAGK